jgi:flagellin-specific chaperone FliS
MKLFICLAITIVSSFSWVHGQDNASSSKKPKPIPKSLELMKLMEEDSDVLFNENQISNKKIEDYISNIKNVSGAEKGEFSILKISSELVRIYSYINNRVYKCNLDTKQEVKKIADVIEKANNVTERLIGVNNGDHLLLLNSLKINDSISVSFDNQTYNLKEMVRDENWNLALYEWEKKPLKGLIVTTMDSVSPMGSIIYKLGLKGDIAPYLVSLENWFTYKEKKYKAYQVLGLETIYDGDYFFNEKGSLVGVVFELKGKKIVLDGYFINVISNEMFVSSGGNVNLGVVGSFSEKGYLVNSVINQDNKIFKNDIIQEVDKVKITKENIYSIKQSLKRKKTIDVKVLRGDKQETIKCSTIKELNLSNLKSFTEAENKIIIWIDPIDSMQITEAIKFITFCQSLPFSNYELKFYRIKEDSLLNWFATVKLIRYLIANKKNDVLVWFQKNPFQDSDEFLSKLGLAFTLTQDQCAEILNNKNEEEIIMNDYTNGMLKNKIFALPALSFPDTVGVPKTQEFSIWVRDFIDANSL